MGTGPKHCVTQLASLSRTYLKRNVNLKKKKYDWVRVKATCYSWSGCTYKKGKCPTPKRHVQTIEERRVVEIYTDHWEDRNILIYLKERNVSRGKYANYAKKCIKKYGKR